MTSTVPVSFRPVRSGPSRTTSSARRPVFRNPTIRITSAVADYHDIQTRVESIIFPTAAERAGDFSGLTTQGHPVIIYDPLTSRTVNGAVVRDPFLNNKIDPSRINPVAAAMLKYLPIPDRNADDGTTNFTRIGIRSEEH